MKKFLLCFCVLALCVAYTTVRAANPTMPAPSATYGPPQTNALVCNHDAIMPAKQPAFAQRQYSFESTMVISVTAPVVQATNQPIAISAHAIMNSTSENEAVKIYQTGSTLQPCEQATATLQAEHANRVTGSIQKE